MTAHGIRRIAVISAAPAGPRGEQSPLNRRVLMPLLDRFFGSSYDDMRRMEEVLRESDRDWVSVRPPRLLEKPPTGAYRLDTSPLPKMRTLTYGDLAAALLDALGREDLYRRAVYVAN